MVGKPYKPEPRDQGNTKSRRDVKSFVASEWPHPYTTRLSRKLDMYGAAALREDFERARTPLPKVEVMLMRATGRSPEITDAGIATVRMQLLQLFLRGKP